MILIRSDIDIGPFGAGKYHLQVFKTSYPISGNRTENTEDTMPLQ